MQTPFLVGRQLRIGIDGPCTAGSEGVETVRAKLVQQDMAQPVYLRGQARQVVDKTIP